MKADKQCRKEWRDVFAPRTPQKFFSYGRGPTYRVAHACFHCRRSMKLSTNPSASGKPDLSCSLCGAPLHSMGRSFKAPKRTDREQWEKVQALWNAGFRFHSYRDCPEAEPLPDRLREVEEFIRRNRDHPLRERN